MILVCFAVKEEAGGFNRRAGSRASVSTLITGMGKENAERAIRAALANQRPSLVLSCGFAGGLRPELAAGTVLFAADGQTKLISTLVNAGAHLARFHCSQRVASTAEQKNELRRQTGADAVEMESQIICAICHEQNIPSGIVRVILDTSEEDLPLDFNAIMTEDQRMHFGKLALALIKSPGKIRGLLRLQKQARLAAEKLGQVLDRVTA